MADNLLERESNAAQIERFAGIGRLPAQVAHEVRNPLSVLGTYLPVLRRRGVDPAVPMRCSALSLGSCKSLVDYARPVPEWRRPPT
ncbi:MAG: hypothetical protein ACR2HK_02235 [Gemmatimonadales bacterium]